MPFALTEGVFVAFEGLDASGKNTQLLRAAEYLATMYGAVTTWAEPNDDTIPGAKARRILQKKEPKPEDPREFQRVYVIDRALNVFDKLLPALLRKEVVLADRFAFSTLAYGMLSGVPPEALIALHDEVLGSFMRWPRVSIFIDTPPHICAERNAERARKTGREPELFDRMDFMHRVRANYLELKRLTETPPSGSPLARIGTMKVVNGEGTPEEVFLRVKSVLDRTFYPFQVSAPLATL